VLLDNVGIDPALVNQRFIDIQSMMQRRHKIVYRADANLFGGSGQDTAQSISQTLVNCWKDAVQNFATVLLAQF
jgi:hypothetical protein